MRVDRLDHIVLTVRSVEETVAFYERVLGMRGEVFGGGRVALAFGDQKINLHLAGQEFNPHAAVPVPGSADFCLTTTVPIGEVVTHLAAQGVDLLIGPVPKVGARANLRSVYFRDPSGNLVEVANEVTE